MTSSVRHWPNYYDVLGLSTEATQEEIGKAFARGMGMFGAHPVSAAAQISAAFETLRNPMKRRAYDEAMGIARSPQPKRHQWSMAIPAQTTRGFVASLAGPAEAPASETLAAKRLERLARLAGPEPLTAALDVRRNPQAKAERPAPPRTKPPEAPLRAAPEAIFPSEELRTSEWKRPLLVLGGLFLAAGLIGALAGSSVLGPEQAQPTASRPLVGRRVAPHATTTPPLTAPVDQPVKAAFVPARPERKRSARPSVHLVEVDATPNAPAEPTGTEVADNSAAPAASQSGDDGPSPAVETIAAAGLPVAAGVMARTIERIGYACGSVASASPAGAAGVYKVTCTSGDSYRAAPVHGRYRFKRWSSR